MKLSDRLKTQRVDKLAELENLNATVGTTRSFTDAEQKSWDELKASIDSIDAQITSAVAREELARSSTPAPAVHRERTLAAGEVRAYTNKERMFQPTTAGEQPRLGNLVRAMATGDWSRASVEKAALNETPPSSGQFLVPSAMWSTVVDLARNASVMVKAGSLSIPMSTETMTVAKLLTDPVASWRNESAPITESEPTFGPLVYQARSLGCLVRVSNELLADAIDGGASIENAISKAVALAMDYAALNGSGIAPIPLGIMNTPGIGSVSMGVDGGELINYAPFVNAVGLCRSANEEPRSWVMSARTDTDLNALQNLQGDPMGIPPVVAGLNRLITNSIPDNQSVGTSGAVCSSVIVGDFSQCAFGIRESATMEITNTGGNGTFAQVETLIRVVARMDFHALRPAAFAKVIGIKDTV
jgi:HK97 family phage major capsid protein